MCGIVGYVGKKKAMDILLEGLKKLEYRGYDSAGIALKEYDEIKVFKNKGKVNEIKLNGYVSDSKTGIGHTRWATHGKPSDRNSHPHTSMDGSITVVHNGIIENFSELKSDLIEEGFLFKSDTDTEVIAYLIEKNYEGDLLKAVYKTSDILKGSYAIAVISKDKGDEIVVAKKGSPLIIGIGDGENIIASDIPAIIKYTNEIKILEDGEFAVLKSEQVDIYNNNMNKIEKKSEIVDYDIEDAQKNGFDHFMLKEIYDQVDMVDSIFNFNAKLNKINIDEFDKIHLVACGTAFYAALILKEILKDKTDKVIESQVASEYRYSNNEIDEKTLVIVVSQSGETADTLAALELAKKKKAKTLGFINVVGSTMARKVNEVIYTSAGPEIAVASTKAYTSQVLNMINIFDKKDDKSKIKNAIENILDKKEDIKKMANKYKNIKNAFYLGRGIDEKVAREGALKLKEVSYIHSESYPAGELKHGPIALIEDDTLVIGLITNEKLLHKTLSNIEEVKSRGAKILIITTSDEEEIFEVADDVILIDDLDNKYLNAMISNIPQQLLAYYISTALGNDVDMPRNLAKSVTVE